MFKRLVAVLVSSAGITTSSIAAPPSSQGAVRIMLSTLRIDDLSDKVIVCPFCQKHDEPRILVDWYNRAGILVDSNQFPSEAGFWKMRRGQTQEDLTLFNEVIPAGERYDVRITVHEKDASFNRVGAVRIVIDNPGGTPTRMELIPGSETRRSGCSENRNPRFRMSGSNALYTLTIRNQPTMTPGC